MSTAIESAPIPEVIEPAWTPLAADRCDACFGDVSRAYAKAEKGKKQLLFCAHHIREFEAQLIANGWNLHSRLDILEDEVRKYKGS